MKELMEILEENFRPYDAYAFEEEGKELLKKLSAVIGTDVDKYRLASSHIAIYKGVFERLATEMGKFLKEGDQA